MADYRGSGAYKFELFEPQREPQRAPKKKEAVGPQRIVKPAPKSKAQLRAEAVEANKRIVKVVTVAVVLFALIGSVIFSRASLTAIARETAQQQTVLEQQKSEGVRLQSAIIQKMSMDEIEDYAVNRLGMVKSSRSQITYIKLNQGNSVVYSEGSDKKPN